MNNFYAYNGIEIRGSVDLAYAASFRTSQNLTLNQSANLTTESSGPDGRGSVVANNIISSGFIAFYRKNIDVTGSVLISSAGDADFCNRRSRPGDCELSLSDSSIGASNISIWDGGQYASTSSNTTVRDAFQAYEGGTVTFKSSSLTGPKLYSTVSGGKFEVEDTRIEMTNETAIGWNWDNGATPENEYATIRMRDNSVFILGNDVKLKLRNGGRLCYTGTARIYFHCKEEGKFYCADKNCALTNFDHYRGAGVGRKDGWRTITSCSRGGNWNDNRGDCTGRN